MRRLVAPLFAVPVLTFDTVRVAGGAVDAGAGKDHVAAACVHGQVAVLGPGDDSYVSTGLVDEVDLGRGDSVERERSCEVSVPRTRAGARRAGPS